MNLSNYPNLCHIYNCTQLKAKKKYNKQEHTHTHTKPPKNKKQKLDSLCWYLL